MQKQSAFLAAFLLSTQNKRNTLFYWPMLLMKHFKYVYKSFDISGILPIKARSTLATYMYANKAIWINTCIAWTISGQSEALLVSLFSKTKHFLFFTFNKQMLLANCFLFKLYLENAKYSKNKRQTWNSLTVSLPF